MRRYLLGASLLSLVSLPAYGMCADQVQLMTASAVEARLSPPGSGTVASIKKVSMEAPAEPRDPKMIYDTFCFVCHASGAAGAPKLGDKAAWAPREKAGMDVMLQHVVQGYKAMPPKGTCANCSEDELKQTIEYMTSQ